MEYFEKLVHIAQQLNMDAYIVLIFLVSGFFAKAYWDNDTKIPMSPFVITMTWKVLILGSIFTTIYASLAYESFSRETNLRIFNSWLISTGLYQAVIKEILAKRIINWLKSLTPKE